MTTKEIYAHLIQKTDLHSQPELHDEILIWHLYENAYVQAFFDNEVLLSILLATLYLLARLRTGTPMRTI